MTEPASLTPSQKDFLARACAFIASGPPREDIERLLVFAALQLPERVVELLRQRADMAAGAGPVDAGIARWLQ